MTSLWVLFTLWFWFKPVVLCYVDVDRPHGFKRLKTETFRNAATAEPDFWKQ